MSDFYWFDMGDDPDRPFVRLADLGDSLMIYAGPVMAVDTLEGVRFARECVVHDVDSGDVFNEHLLFVGEPS